MYNPIPPVHHQFSCTHWERGSKFSYIQTDFQLEKFRHFRIQCLKICSLVFIYIPSLLSVCEIIIQAYLLKFDGGDGVYEIWLFFFSFSFQMWKDGTKYRTKAQKIERLKAKKGRNSKILVLKLGNFSNSFFFFRSFPFFWIVWNDETAPKKEI